MDLRFEVNNQLLKRMDNEIIVNKSKNYLNCIFFFKTHDWDNLDKIAIFKNENGEIFKKYLGDSNECSCIIPNNALTGDFFTVSVYGGNLITTNEKIVVLLKSGYMKKHSHNHFDGDKDIFIQIFENLHEKIDEILVENNVLSVRRGQNVEPLFEYIVDTELSSTSDNPISNKVVYDALQNKVDTSRLNDILDDVTLIIDVMDNLSKVSSSGDYNDLNNIPETFNPSPHTHESSDVVDLNNNIELDLNNLLDDLVENIRLI